MYRLWIENEIGDKLELTYNPLYAVTGVTGLTPVPAVINLSTAGINDGETFNSARLGSRNIVITLRYKRDVEAARIALYDYIASTSRCRVYYKNGMRDVYIDGYVENPDSDLFTLGQVMQISIICPDPLFRDVKTVTDTGATVSGGFKFPTTLNAVVFGTVKGDTTTPVINGGNVAAGMDIQITFDGDVSNPIIYNAASGDYFGFNRDFIAGDVVNIQTYGHKSVTLTRYGVKFNLINYRKKGTKWLQLAKGTNTFTFAADSGVNNMRVDFIHTDLYVGV